MTTGSTIKIYGEVGASSKSYDSCVDYSTGGLLEFHFETWEELLTDYDHASENLHQTADMASKYGLLTWRLEVTQAKV